MLSKQHVFSTSPLKIKIRLISAIELFNWCTASERPMTSVAYRRGIQRNRNRTQDVSFKRRPLPRSRPTKYLQSCVSGEPTSFRNFFFELSLFQVFFYFIRFNFQFFKFRFSLKFRFSASLEIPPKFQQPSRSFFDSESFLLIGFLLLLLLLLLLPLLLLLLLLLIYLFDSPKCCCLTGVSTMR